MGILEDFGSFIPADKQESFKAAVSSFDGAVKIDSRETLDKLAESNNVIKSWKDSVISRAVASHDEKFKAETLPNLLEEEIRKRGPKPKDPELAAALERVEKLEKAKATAEAEARRVTQLSKVLPKITEWGLDAEFADRLIGDNDEATDAMIAKFEKSFTKARDGYTERVIKEKFGNQPVPPMGGSRATSREALVAQMNELAKNPNTYQQALMLQDQINRMKE